MKAYGVRKKDVGCCPGHYKYTGGNRALKRKTRAVKDGRRAAKKRERRKKTDEE